MLNAYSLTTLQFKKELCNNCKMCTIVCPHHVFKRHNGIVQLVHPERCMECGACQHNCPVGAISVDSGVGCASAMIYAALRGKKAIELRPIKADPWASGEEILLEIANIYIIVGEYGKATDLIEKLFSIPCQVTEWLLKLDPIYDSIGNQPRFQKLIEKN